jgi:hypothetical protein
VWGSMALSPVAMTGVLSGTVVESVAPGAPIGGATVLVGGQSLTTSATGTFSVTLPVGATTVQVSKPGFTPRSQMVTVAAGSNPALRLSLERRAANQAPTVTWTSPETNGVFTVATLELTGTVTDDDALSTVVVQHGGTSLEVPVVQGRFSTTLRLAAGPNVVTATATDAMGLSGSAVWSGSFRAGFGGAVRRFDTSDAIVSDAVLTLVDVATDEVLGTARSDENGRYEIDSTRTGPARLRIVAEGYTPQELPVDVSADERTSLDVGLTPGATTGIRFIEPKGEGPFTTDVITVSGAVTGLEVVSVTVNGEPATLFGYGFVIKLPLPEGETVFEAVAESADGQTVRGSITVTRPATKAAMPGGCVATPGAGVLALGLVLALRRRRRSGSRVAGST